MKAPRKLYMVVSRKAKTQLNLVAVSYKGAIKCRDAYNEQAYLGCTDWRIETYVKGD